MTKFRKIYLEISNVCNLHCCFCPGTARTPRVMTPEEAQVLLPKLRPWSDFLYFHLMGEPLLHPHLETLLQMAGAEGFRVILTTNGTLLHQQQEMLLKAEGLHKVNISLHAFEANDLSVPFEDYLSGCLQYARAAEGKKLTVLRLWNNGGQDSLNRQILQAMEEAFPHPWKAEPRGTRIGDRVYLEYGDKFDWPDLNAPEQPGKIFCYGLRDQIGILCDGTVVPCCLDHEGDLTLGNLWQSELSDILETPRAKAIYEGFSDRTAAEPLCRKCGYARRFSGK